MSDLEDARLESGTFTDSLYAITLIVERYSDLLPKFTQLLVRILDEDWYHPNLRVALAGCIAAHLSDERAK